MPHLDPRKEFRAVTRAAQHVWLAVAFLLAWIHFSYVQQNLHRLDWQIYSLYFLGVAGVAARYLTGIRHGHEPWHRVLFDGLSILLISVGVNMTGGIRSELWLVYFIFVIAETLAASARGLLVTDTLAVLSYVVATWPSQPSALQEYLERLVTHVFFLVLVASIARTVASEERRRQEDLAALREALSVSEERRRLARDLHDGVGHVLTRVILQLEVSRRQHAQDPDAAEAMRGAAADLRGAMEEMRQIVATLRTDTAAFDVQRTVRALAANLTEHGALEVAVNVPEEPLPLSVHRQYHLSRLLQEALTNCMRHAEATHASVEIHVERNPVGVPLVIAEVIDNGKGFDLDTARRGSSHGLQGMRERLEPYGGTVHIETGPGKGTRVTAEVPGDLD